jgi:hypothetical protein
VNHDWLADNLFDCHAGIKRTVRILEDDLHIAPNPTQFTASGSKNVVAVKAHGPRIWLDQPQQYAPEGAFAATRLPDQADGFARLNRQRDVIYRSNPVCRCGSEGALSRAERLYQVVCLHKRHVADGNK